MSITYKAELSTPASPRTVVAAILEAAAESRLVERHDAGSGSLRGGGWFEAEVAELDPPDPVQQSFGFTPTVEVFFGLHKFGDLRGQENDVLRLVLGLLDRVPGDAVLHHQHEEVWLLRRDGRLTINEDLWTPEQLTKLSQPFDRGRPAFG